MARTFSDKYGTELDVIGETALPGCARVGVSERCGIHVEGADFPALIAALYEAAGLPAPVILERPEIVPGGDGETGINIFTVKLEPHLGSIGIRYHGAPAAAIVAPGPARLLASVIAAYADAAESEQDAAEVEELTSVLRGVVPGMASPGSDYKTAAARGFAEAALRWFRDRQQRGGTL